MILQNLDIILSEIYKFFQFNKKAVVGKHGPPEKSDRPSSHIRLLGYRLFLISHNLTSLSITIMPIFGFLIIMSVWMGKTACCKNFGGTRTVGHQKVTLLTISDCCIFWCSQRAALINPHCLRSALLGPHLRSPFQGLLRLRTPKNVFPSRILPCLRYIYWAYIFIAI